MLIFQLSKVCKDIRYADHVLSIFPNILHLDNIILQDLELEFDVNQSNKEGSGLDVLRVGSSSIQAGSSPSRPAAPMSMCKSKDKFGSISHSLEINSSIVNKSSSVSSSTSKLDFFDIRLSRALKRRKAKASSSGSQHAQPHYPTGSPFRAKSSFFGNPTQNPIRSQSPFALRAPSPCSIPSRGKKFSPQPPSPSGFCVHKSRMSHSSPYRLSHADAHGDGHGRHAHLHSVSVDVDHRSIVDNIKSDSKNEYAIDEQAERKEEGEGGLDLSWLVEEQDYVNLLDTETLTTPRSENNFESDKERIGIRSVNIHHDRGSKYSNSNAEGTRDTSPPLEGKVYIKHRERESTHNFPEKVITKVAQNIANRKLLQQHALDVYIDRNDNGDLGCMYDDEEIDFNIENDYRAFKVENSCNASDSECRKKTTSHPKTQSDPQSDSQLALERYR